MVVRTGWIPKTISCCASSLAIHEQSSTLSVLIPRSENTFVAPNVLRSMVTMTLLQTSVPIDPLNLASLVMLSSGRTAHLEGKR